jgi:hypothetical protein
VSERIHRFIRHAERFGAECVYETARELLIPAPVDLTWLTPAEREQVLDGRTGFAELTQLRAELDKIERERKRGRYTVGKRRRRSHAETYSMIVALREQGLVEAAIANKLGISRKWLRELSGEQSETAQNGGRKPAWLSGKMASETEPLGAGPP